MKWVRIHAGKYTFGLGAKPRFVIVDMGEGEKRWWLSGDELVTHYQCRSLKAAKEYAKIVMEQAQKRWEKEHGAAT